MLERLISKAITAVLETYPMFSLITKAKKKTFGCKKKKKKKNMKLFEIERSATVSWCPSPSHGSLLAAGDVAGAIDLSFSSAAKLEIIDTASGKERNKIFNNFQRAEIKNLKKKSTNL